MAPPIFILATSPRSGSTWLQRVLTSTGDVLVWGELTTNGVGEWPVRRYEEWQRFRWSPDRPMGNDWDKYAFNENSAGMWMAVLAPTRLKAACCERDRFEQLYQPVAKSATNQPRWGTKETYWSEATVGFLRWAWPEAPILYLSRRFEDAYQSRYSESYTSRMGVEADKRLFCDRWIEQGRLAVKYGSADYCGRKLRYEALTPLVLNQLCTSLGLSLPDPKQYEPRIGVSVHGGFSEADEVIFRDYRERIHEVSEALGHPCEL